MPVSQPHTPGSAPVVCVRPPSPWATAGLRVLQGHLRGAGVPLLRVPEGPRGPRRRRQPRPAGRGPVAPHPLPLSKHTTPVHTYQSIDWVHPIFKHVF